MDELLDRCSPAQRAVLADAASAAAAVGASAYLVGGSVRDLCLRAAGRTPPQRDEVDLAIEGDALAVADVWSSRTGFPVDKHPRFGTATLHAPGRSIDLASTRTERYSHPGALPEPSPAGLLDDLRRRDFTLNSMALALAPDDWGQLIDPCGGLEDLQRAELRVHHAGSFVDDPTRTLRGLRFAARLELSFEARTEQMLRSALESGQLLRVSRDRRDREVDKLLDEPWPQLGAQLLEHSGLVEPAPERRLPTIGQRFERAAAELSTWQRPPLRHVGWIMLAADWSAAARADWSAGPAHPLDAIEPVRRLAEARQSEGSATPGDWFARAPRVAAADWLAAAVLLPDFPEDLRRLAQRLRCTALPLRGDDLLAAGIPPGQAIGRGLAAARRLQLDEPNSDRRSLLERALRAARA